MNSKLTTRNLKLSRSWYGNRAHRFSRTAYHAKMQIIVIPQGNGINRVVNTRGEGL